MGCVCSKAKQELVKEPDELKIRVLTPLLPLFESSTGPVLKENPLPEQKPSAKKMIIEEGKVKQVQEQPMHNPDRAMSLGNSAYYSIKVVCEPNLRLASDSSEFFYTAKLQGPEYYSSIVDQFEWGCSRQGMLERASKALTGLSSAGIYIYELFESFKDVLIEAAMHYHNTGAKEEYFAEWRLPGPLDLFWVIAISHSADYNELCEKLIGQTIHRKDSQHSYVKPIPLYKCYDEAAWELDRETTL